MIDAQPGGWELRERHVDDRQRVDRAKAVEAAFLLHVAHHADDLAGGVGDADVGANGLAVPQIALRERFVDDDDRGAARGVAIADHAAAPGGHAQRLEVAGRDVGEARQLNIAGGIAVGADDPAGHVEDALVGQAERDRRRLHAGQGAHAGEALVEETRNRVVRRVARVLERRRRRHHVVRVEARRQRLQMHERSDQESRRHQEHHAERHFADHEQTPRPAARAACHRSRAALRQRRLHIEPRGMKRRHEPEGDRGERGQAERDAQHAAIERGRSPMR